ncbi:MAG: hypothetical protein ACOYK7_12965 [Pirellulales bacterium]|jgi:membrane protein implicated in regulation of membrane protease activity
MRLDHRLLSRCVALVVLLPIALLVILGLGALLSGLGDRAGAIVCARVALCGAVAWLVGVIAMAVVTAVAVVGTPRPLPRERVRWDGRHRGMGPRGRRFRPGGKRRGRLRSVDDPVGDAADG